MGGRAALEAVMIDKVGDHSYFRTNLLEFQRAGYVSVS